MKKRVFFAIIFLFAAVLAAVTVYLSVPVKIKAGSYTGRPLKKRINETAAPGGLHIVSWNTGYLYKGKSFSSEQPPGERQPVKADTAGFFIKNQKPDIVLLQECSSTQAAELDAILKSYEVYFESGDPVSRLSKLFGSRKPMHGMAVLSKFKALLVSAEHLLPAVKENDNFSYFFHSIRLPSADPDTDWLVTNAGINDTMTDLRKDSWIKAVIRTMQAKNNNQAALICADFSIFSEAEIISLENSLPPGWTMHRAGNAPDGREKNKPYSRLKSKTWNRVLFIASDNVLIEKVFCHNLKFSDTPGNPVSVIVSVR